MNILFVSCKYNLFDKIDCGAATRSTLFVKALTTLGHVDVISFGKEQIKSNIPNCDVVYSKHLEPTFHFKDKIRTRILYILKPFDPNSYYVCDKKRKLIVEDQLSAKKYDLVACRYIEEMISSGLQKYSDRLIIDYDDNLVNAFKRNAKNPKLRFDIRVDLFIKSLFVGKMSERVLSSTKCSFFSNITESPCKNSIFLHNVPSIVRPAPTIQHVSPKRLLFIGWLDYFPNKSGLLHFLNKVYPLIQKQIPDVEFHIAGKTNDLKFISRIQSISGVKYLGYVRNLNQEYKNCRVIIVPIYQGAGTSVKFVEGLFTNRPMVSTPMGARGFENTCQDKVHYMLAKTDKEFANKTIELLLSIDTAIKMAQLAYDAGTSHYSQDKFIKIVKNAVIAKINIL